MDKMRKYLQKKGESKTSEWQKYISMNDKNQYRMFGRQLNFIIDYEELVDF